MEGFAIKKILVLPVIVMLITILSFLPQNAHAATSYELQVGDANGACEAIGGTWDSGTNTCTLPSGISKTIVYQVKIDSGVTLQIDSNAAITIQTSFSVENYGTIINNSGGTIDITGGTINNFGTITNNSIFVSDGTTNNNLGGTFTNNGRIEGNPGSLLNNSGGTIFNNGGIVNLEVFANSGTITNTLGASIDVLAFDRLINNGTINNAGAINNSGTINEICGASVTGNPVQGTAPINTCKRSYELQVGNANGACEAIGGRWNSGTNTCTLDGTLLLNVGDTLTIDSNVILDATGRFINFGTFNNFGTITNSGGFTNLGTINKECGASIIGNPVQGTAPVNISCPDTTPPTITGTPADITVHAKHKTGVVVTYSTPTATDNVDGSVPVTCTPPSRSTFPIGTTTVTSTTTDSHGTSASTTFHVIVTHKNPHME